MKCKRDVLVTSPTVSFTHFLHLPLYDHPRRWPTRRHWLIPVWRQLIYDWWLLKLSATVLDDWSCLMLLIHVLFMVHTQSHTHTHTHTHTHHGGIKQLQSFEHCREWRDVTLNKLTVGIRFYTHFTHFTTLPGVCVSLHQCLPRSAVRQSAMVCVAL